MKRSALFSTLALLSFASLVRAVPADYFRVSVVDADSGRGVPLVELRTTSNERFVTDSNGLVAINEPELMGHSVYFSVQSHGYELGADGFGNRGQAFDVRAGGSAQIKIKRQNIAERLYRLTGAGMYRDSILLGEKVPLANPLLNGGVTGQDTVMATPYKGKIAWFWGDTNRFDYPLGNFATSGATSQLPQSGGLSPDVGVDYTYWTNENGFAKAMLPLPGFGGPIWVGGVFTLSQNGQEQLFTHYAHLEGSGKVGEHGLAQFNDAKAVFEKVRAFDGPLRPDGQPFQAWVRGVPYLYFQSDSTEAMPLVRVRADREHVLNPLSYEAFTPLVAGTQGVGDAPPFQRDGAGKLVYSWKPNTSSIGFESRKKAVAAGQLKIEEVPFQLRDIETDAPIQSHGGSVYWNDFRQKWVMISGQANGSSSYLGELWFSEADTPVGPWAYARKIITHQKYTFYNPTQHPWLDQNGGRQIYFEGTYTSTYSGTDTPTPLYDYNQIMYRLDLGDARLTLPSPVYALQNGAAPTTYAMRDEVEARKSWPQIGSAPFFAVSPARTHDGLVPIFQAANGQLSTKPTTGAAPLFYALPAPTEKQSPAALPLYAVRDEKSGRTRYSTDINAGETRVGEALCRVWRNPSTTLALDWEAKPKP